MKKNKVDFSIQLFQSKGEIYLRLNGYSMFPLLRRGDIALIKKTKIESLRIGDVIVFRREDNLIAHRLFKKERVKENYVLITKGDTSFKCDEPFTEDLYVGKIVSFKRNEKDVNIETIFYRLLGLVIIKTSLFNSPFFVINKRIWQKYLLSK